MSQSLASPFLSVTVTQKSFGDTVLLGDISFTLEANKLLVILGPSGCGKTTLLRIVSGLDREFDGGVRLESELVTRPTPQIAMMFQDVRLFPWLTVRRNLAFAAAAAASDNYRPDELLQLVGLPPGSAGLYPRQLSGGMAKRVALARAFAGDPTILLLDEPFSDLDPKAKYSLYDSLVTAANSPRRPMSVVMVTHDIGEAVFLADEIVVLSSKRPTTIASVVPVRIPRPRRRDDPEFVRQCTALMMVAISDLDAILIDHAHS